MQKTRQSHAIHRNR